jgi:hypothetical protein
MGPVPRWSSIVAGVLLAVGALLITGCGGSLADTDAPNASQARRVPPGDFCTAVRAGADATRPLAALVGRGGTVPRAQLSEAAAQVRSANADVLATAPGEIRAEVERSVAAVDLQLSALEAAEGDTGAVARDGALRSRLTAPEYTAATQRVREYVGSHCGIDGARLDD